MVYCRQCGAALEEHELFCSSCGAPCKSEAVQVPPVIAEGTIQDPEGYIWETHIPVLTSSIAMKQLALALGGGILVVAGLMAAIDSSAMVSVLPILLGIYLFLLVLGFIIAAVLQAGTKGGPLGQFAVTREGVGYNAGSTSRMINLATLGGSAVGGSLAGGGGSLINMAREMDFIEWRNVRSATARTSDRSIVVYRKELISPVALYCTEENFGPVVAMVCQYAPEGSFSMKRW